jgi:hypothetical protein
MPPMCIKRYVLNQKKGIYPKNEGQRKETKLKNETYSVPLRNINMFKQSKKGDGYAG